MIFDLNHIFSPNKKVPKINTKKVSFLLVVITQTKSSIWDQQTLIWQLSEKYPASRSQCTVYLGTFQKQHLEITYSDKKKINFFSLEQP